MDEDGLPAEKWTLCRLSEICQRPAEEINQTKQRAEYEARNQKYIDQALRKQNHKQNRPQLGLRISNSHAEGEVIDFVDEMAVTVRWTERKTGKVSESTYGWGAALNLLDGRES